MATFCSGIPNRSVASGARRGPTRQFSWREQGHAHAPCAAPMATRARRPLSLRLATTSPARLCGPRLGGIVVCLLVLATGCSSSKAAEKDVTITACKAGADGGHPTADGRITNHSSKDSAYTVHV